MSNNWTNILPPEIWGEEASYIAITFGEGFYGMRAPLTSIQLKALQQYAIAGQDWRWKKLEPADFIKLQTNATDTVQMKLEIDRLQAEGAVLKEKLNSITKILQS